MIASRRVKALKPGRLARNTVLATCWNGARIALQACTLVLLAHLFGADGYGKLAGVSALYVSLAQLTGLGSGIALVRHVARQGDLESRTRATQWVYLLTGSTIAALAWPASLWLLDKPLAPVTMACLAIAEMIVAPCTLPLTYRYQAQERMFVSGALLTAAPVARLAGALACVLLDSRSLQTYAESYLCLLSIVSIGSLALVRPEVRTTHSARRLREVAKEGLPYVVSGAAITAGSEIDKTVLLRVAGSLDTGHYSAAYRIMQAATLPINSLVLAAIPRLFRDERESHHTGHKLTLLTILYGVIAALSVWLAAPLLPIVLGGNFQPSVDILRVMSLLVVTGCTRQMLVARLTASDRQVARNIIEATAIGLSIAIMLVLVPWWGISGAIAASAMADVSVCLAVWIALRRSRMPRPEPAGGTSSHQA